MPVTTHNASVNLSQPANKHGVNQHNEDMLHNMSSDEIGSTNSTYLQRHMARDAPEVLQDLIDGKYDSTIAAARAGKTIVNDNNIIIDQNDKPQRESSVGTSTPATIRRLKKDAPQTTSARHMARRFFDWCNLTRVLHACILSRVKTQYVTLNE